MISRPLPRLPHGTDRRLAPQAAKWKLSRERRELTLTRQARRGLAPVELVLALPVWMMIAALMILVGTTGAWRIRGQGVAREAAFRALWPRTRSGDAPPAEWFPAGAHLDVSTSATAVQLDDPLAGHVVIRGPRLIDPKTGRGFPVNSDVMRTTTDVIVGHASLIRASTVWPKLGFQYRFDRDFPILNGDAGQFDSGPAADNRRSLRIWNLSETSAE